MMSKAIQSGYYSRPIQSPDPTQRTLQRSHSTSCTTAGCDDIDDDAITYMTGSNNHYFANDDDGANGHFAIANYDDDDDIDDDDIDDDDIDDDDIDDDVDDEDDEVAIEAYDDWSKSIIFMTNDDDDDDDEDYGLSMDTHMVCDPCVTPLMESHDQDGLQLPSRLDFRLGRLKETADHSDSANSSLDEEASSEHDCKALSDLECDEPLRQFDPEDHFMQYDGFVDKDLFGAPGVVGNGASGEVKKAFEYASCRLVALKKCRSKKPHKTEEFKKEAHLYRVFDDHEYIVKSYELPRDAGHEMYIALEWMDLGSADTLEIQPEQRENVVGHIAISVVRALVAMHEKRYIHNDIKPANILCNKYGEVKLSDFGCVSELEEKDAFCTEINGTTQYQSPEKLVDGEFNTKSDIWSLGITLYELLCGEDHATNEMAYIKFVPRLYPNMQHLSDQCSSPNYTTFSAQCCDFINSCLCVDDEKRPSAAELLQSDWMSRIQSTQLESKWPWLAPTCSLSEPQQQTHEARVGREASLGDLTQSQYHNTDLLFMITALIVYYSRQDENPNDSIVLGRQKSTYGDRSYSDEERINNMARSALCSREMVIERIQVTVASIKSQHMAEKSRKSISLQDQGVWALPFADEEHEQTAPNNQQHKPN